jgi:transcriptional regulator with XRE-family HTH domain
MTDALAREDVDVDRLVADNVRAELARDRWTGRKAAAALGLTPTYVSRRLSGLTLMSPGDLQMFADLVNVPVARFFELPHLDSNQEPIGSEPEHIGELVDISRQRKLKGSNGTPAPTTSTATITPIDARTDRSRRA